ncbi:hypothetical protein B0G71_8243 [Paraburkholderia sp. BL27I4N3]|nr:hypothetical protein B0G71_8243 [Paraburkholderia sp. BL27I4N3]
MKYLVWVPPPSKGYALTFIERFFKSFPMFRGFAWNVKQVVTGVK